MRSQQFYAEDHGSKRGKAKKHSSFYTITLVVACLLLAFYFLNWYRSGVGLIVLEGGMDRVEQTRYYLQGRLLLLPIPLLGWGIHLLAYRRDLTFSSGNSGILRTVVSDVGLLGSILCLDVVLNPPFLREFELYCALVMFMILCRVAVFKIGK